MIDLSTWTELPVCPACRRPILDGHVHTVTEFYNPAAETPAGVEARVLRGWAVSKCVVTVQKSDG